MGTGSGSLRLTLLIVSLSLSKLLSQTLELIRSLCDLLTQLLCTLSCSVWHDKETGSVSYGLISWQLVVRVSVTGE